MVVLLLFIACFIGLNRSYRTVLQINRNEVSLLRLSAGFGKPNKEAILSSKLLESNIKPHSESLCKCSSGLFYGDCCEKFHNQSEFPENPASLVRSRFCAYAIGNSSYIMETTHPSHKEYATVEQSSKRKTWQKTLLSFIRDYEFKSLELSPPPNPVTINATTAMVAFHAKVKRKTTPVDPNIYPVVVIDELSTFKRDKSNTKWLYSDGVLNPAMKV